MGLLQACTLSVHTCMCVQWCKWGSRLMSWIVNSTSFLTLRVYGMSLHWKSWLTCYILFPLKKTRTLKADVGFNKYRMIGWGWKPSYTVPQNIWKTFMNNQHKTSCIKVENKEYFPPVWCRNAVMLPCWPKAPCSLSRVTRCCVAQSPWQDLDVLREWTLAKANVDAIMGQLL